MIGCLFYLVTNACIIPQHLYILACVGDYSLFQNDTIISQFVCELCGFWEQARSEDFMKKLDVSRESGQDLDERFVKFHLTPSSVRFDKVANLL